MATEIKDMHNKKNATTEFDRLKSSQPYQKNKVKKNSGYGFATQYNTITEETVTQEPVKLPTNNKNSRNNTTSSSSSVGSASKTTNRIRNENIMFKRVNIPIIGHLLIETQYKIMSILGILSMICFIGSVYLTNVYKESKYHLNDIVNNLEANLQKHNSLVLSAFRGEEGKYLESRNTWIELETQFNSLNYVSIDANSTQIKNNIQSSFANIQKNVSNMENGKEYLITNSKVINGLNDNLNKINILSSIVVSNSDRTSVLAIEHVNKFKTFSGLLSSNVTELTNYPTINTNIYANINDYKQEYRKLLVDLFKGNPTYQLPSIKSTQIKAYNDIATLWPKVNSDLDYLIQNKNNIYNISKSFMDNDKEIKNIFMYANQIKMEHSSIENYKIALGNIFTAVFFFMAVLSIILLFYIYNSEQDTQSQIEKLENNKNQDSIFKLLNEMIPLQDGDLTKKTTVTEEITGAIADSINATIDSLSSLVKKIKKTSNTMKLKTDEVKIISEDMLKITNEQSDSIVLTNEAVNKISKAISEISKKTEESTIIAQESVTVSKEGVQQVLDSIQSMNKIKQNMNETVELMGKVGDSSKQISEIVELLSEITEDTSILSLNATVQAAKAGESGEGFKIVADAIQKLAEDAGEAARKVGNLIGVVQNDIQAVESAVDKTTEEVAKGVELSERARGSINKMSNVSNNLAAVVKNISEDAKENQKISDEISASMNEVLKKIEENKQSTQKTNQSISEISELSDSLGDSVQSFTVK